MIQQSYFWISIRREWKQIIQKKNTHPCIYCGIIYNSQDIEATCVHW